MSKPVSTTTPTASDENVVCPFCKEPGFDLIGLKSHLLAGDCEQFEKLEHVRRMQF